MENLRRGFPVLEQYTYLNTAASGLLPETVWEFRQEHDMDLLLQASVLKEKQGAQISGVRDAVGEFFDCNPNRVALVPNFSIGFNTVLESIENPGTALLLNGDYPSINWAITSRKFNTVYAEINEHLEENVEAALKEHKPQIFAFSIVQYISGVKLEMEFLNKMKEQFPETIFIADGTQYLGTEKFSFESSKIDVLLCSAYKWLNAGYGNGFILFKEGVQEFLKPKALGFNSLQGKYKELEDNFIGKFEPGHLDTLNFGSLKEALNHLERTGLEAIFSQITLLKTKAKAAFERLGLLEKDVVQRNNHSSIFNLKGDAALFNYLKSKGIICSQRGTGIRVSFHYFNTEKELNTLIAELKKFKG